MKKGQSFDAHLVLRVWKEMLQEWEEVNPPPYPSSRSVASRLSELGYKTYNNTPPSYETVRLAMRSTDEGKELLAKASGRFKAGGIHEIRT